MNASATFVLLAFTLTALSVQAGQYMTEEKKALLLEKSTELGQARKRANAQNAIERSEVAKFLATVPTSSNAITYNKIPHTFFVGKIARTPTHTFKPKFNSAGRSVPIYGNRPVTQSRPVAASYNSHRSVQQSRQVAPTARKGGWSNFFRNLALIGGALQQQQQQQQHSQQFFQQQLRQIQQNNNALMQWSNGFQAPFLNGANRGYSPERVYTPGECLGTVSNGQCFGTISPAAKTRYCHGKMINGECMGTVR